MSCCNDRKNPHYKSAQNAYNNTTQTIDATGTPVAVLGILNTDTGCSLATNTGGFVVRHSGLYRIAYDVTFVAGAAGIVTLQGLKDTAALPCMATQATVAANGTYTLHAETTVYIPVCCNGTPTISAALSGVAGTVTHVCASAVKLA
jgi:hypothetical protein